MDETFGQRLRRLRTEQGITAVDLAASCTASEGTIRQLESGAVKMPNFALGLRLANALNVDPLWLAYGKGSSTVERLDAFDRRLAKLERRLDALPQPRR